MVGSDDFMGEAALDLTSLQPRKATDLVLVLTDANDENLVRKNKKRRPLGSIAVRVTLAPLTKDQMNAVRDNVILYVVSSNRMNSDLPYICQVASRKKTG